MDRLNWQIAHIFINGLGGTISPLTHIKLFIFYFYVKTQMSSTSNFRAEKPKAWHSSMHISCAETKIHIEHIENMVIYWSNQTPFVKAREGKKASCTKNRIDGAEGLKNVLSFDIRWL